MLVHGALFAIALAASASAGNTTCLNNSMDWFTRSVGESPCQAYERLRGTCSPGFQVGNMPNTAPGDTCGDQVASCCCNTISFALSMLCMSCQWGIGSGVNQDFGFDAPPGTYAKYLSGCGPVFNRTLPDTVQIAACKQDIKLPSYVYNPSWDSDGSWFFYYTRQSAELAINSGRNETGICADLLVKAAASSESLASATQSLSFPSTVYDRPAVDTQRNSVPVGAVVGGVLGGLALLAGGVVAGYWFSRKRMSQRTVDLDDDHKVGTAYEPYTLHRPAPAPVHVQIPPSTMYGGGLPEWTPGPSSSESNLALTESSAFIVSPVAVPRNQKSRMVIPGNGPSVTPGPSRPYLQQGNSGGENRGNGGASVTSETPPLYELRR